MVWIKQVPPPQLVAPQYRARGPAMALAWSSVAPGARRRRPPTRPPPSVSSSFGFTPQQLLGLRQIQNSAPSWFQAMSRRAQEGGGELVQKRGSPLQSGVVPQPCHLGSAHSLAVLFQMWMSVQQRPLPAATHSTVRMSTAHTRVKVTRVLGPVILHRAPLSSFSL